MTGALVTTCTACGSADCRVAFWADIVKRRAWAGRAVSYEDAQRTLDSARLLCELRDDLGTASGPGWPR